MAGVGFELQRLLRKGTYFNVLQAYTYAGLISAGPWIISIVGILAVEVLKFFEVGFVEDAAKFQLSIVYVIASSLIFSSFAQQSFSRFLADQAYKKYYHIISSNYLGVVLIMTLASGLIAFPLSFALFANHTFVYRMVMPATFVVLCNVWFTTCLLTGLKTYKLITLAFIVGYGLVVACDYFFRYMGSDGLLLGFFIGQTTLLFCMVLILFYIYPPEKIILFDFLKKNKLFYSYIFSALFYNLGVWADKIIFWFSPYTGYSVYPPLRSSLVYDVPMFFAYITIVPGLAVFLLSIETDFVEYYKKYFTVIMKGYSLSDIFDMRYHMVASAKRGIYEIIKVQFVIIAFIFVFGRDILTAWGFSPFYVYLLRIDVVAAGLFVIFAAMLNLFTYLDKRMTVVVLTLLFFILNVVFTLITQFLGAYFFGYGFAFALFVVVIAFKVLDYDFNNLEQQTFMR